MSAKISNFIIAVVSLAVGNAFCQESAAKENDAGTNTSETASKTGITSTPNETAPAQVPPYELKRRSVFNLDAKTRAPFWRIGWEKADPNKPAETVIGVVAAPVIPPGTFKITSVLIGPPSIAVINGRAFEEGEYINLKIGELKHRVLIRQIIQEGVWFELDKKMVFERIAREADPIFNKQEEVTTKGEFEVIVKP